MLSRTNSSSGDAARDSVTQSNDRADAGDGLE